MARDNALKRRWRRHRARREDRRRRRAAVRRGWGTTAEERARSYECERHVDNPLDTFYRAIDIDAPPEIVFRWLCQLRTAPYSYDWIDNLGRRSPRRLTPGLEQLEVGQRLVTIFRIVEFEPGHQITTHIGPWHRWFWGDVASTYRVESRGANASRLIFAWTVHDAPRRFIGRLTGLWYLRKATFPWGELLMAKKQLRTLKELAERHTRERGAAAVTTPEAVPSAQESTS